MADHATLLRDHVTLTSRSVDQIFLQAYVLKLQSVDEVCQCQFLRGKKGSGFPASMNFPTVPTTLKMNTGPLDEEPATGPT